MKVTIIKKLILSVIIFALVISCRDDKLGSSIFDDSIEELDPTSITYSFDKYLRDYFRIPYNVKFIYRLSDVGSPMIYNLIPADFVKSKTMGVLIKYCWFDAYEELGHSLLLRKDGIRIIHLVGSAAVDQYTTIKDEGMNESGVKVTLFEVNRLNEDDPSIKFDYFQKMQCQFMQVLTQKKSIPTPFYHISTDTYKPSGWERVHVSVARSFGFVSPLARRESRSDFAETAAWYIICNEAEWESLLEEATKDWIQRDEFRPWLGVYLDPNDPYTSGVDGKAVIMEKLEICKQYLLDNWDIDIDELRKIANRRFSHINSDFVKELFKDFDIE